METNSIRIDNLGGNPHWVSASDIYKFAGRPDRKGVGNWLKLHSTINLIGNVASILHLDPEKLHKFTPGRNGSTWLYWYIALEYAAYISVDVRTNIEVCLTNNKVIDTSVMDLLDTGDLYKAAEIGWLNQEYKRNVLDYVNYVTERGTYNYQDLSLITSVCLFGDYDTPDVLVDSERLRARNELQRLINQKLKTNNVQDVEDVREVLKQTSVAWLNFQAGLMEREIPPGRIDKLETFPNI